MPRAAILYHSNTGNTRLSCEYIKNRIPQVDFDLFDIKDLSEFDPSFYSIIGFATYVDFYDPPQFFMSTLENIRTTDNKLAFLVCTYGAIPGNTLKSMKRLVEKNGFNVISATSIRMPESYPPMIKKGITGIDNPKEKDMENFRSFIRELGDQIITYDLKGAIDSKPLKIGLFNYFFRRKQQGKAKKKMGKLKLDKGSCTGCGICIKVCPYGAITMKDLPVFNEHLCRGCYSCYNHCPTKAISTEEISSGFVYLGPPEELKKKMSY